MNQKAESNFQEIPQFNPELRRSKEFIKCRLDNFSMGFILLYLNLGNFKINKKL